MFRGYSTALDQICSALLVYVANADAAKLLFLQENNAAVRSLHQLGYSIVRQ